VSVERFTVHRSRFTGSRFTGSRFTGSRFTGSQVQGSPFRVTVGYKQLNVSTTLFSAAWIQHWIRRRRVRCSMLILIDI